MSADLDAQAPVALHATLREIGLIAADYWPAEDLLVWLFAAHPQLDGQSPAQAIQAGRADDVLLTLRRLDEGVYL